MKYDQKCEQIAAAFIDLLRDTPLEKLRTEDLCRHAGISKSTFYRLFRDKYDLAFWIYKKTAEDVISTTPELRNWHEWTHQIFSKIIQYKSFYRNVASYRGQNSLFDCMRDYYQQNILKYRAHPQKSLSEDQKYAVYMFAIVNTQVVIDWILNDFEPSTEIILQRATLCMPECIKEFYQ